MTAYDYYAGRLLYHVISNVRSAARFRRAVQTGLEALTMSPGRGRLESLNESHAMVSNRFFAGTGDLADAVRARALAQQLSGGEGTALSPTGDTLFVTDTHMAVHIEPTRDFQLPLQSLWSIGAPPQPFAVRALYMATRQIRILASTLSH